MVLITNLKHLFDMFFRMPCMFQMLTGLYCPGCGGTRGVNYLLHGRLLESFIYHPLVLYMAVVIAAEAISYQAARCFKRPGLYLGHEQQLIIVAVGIIAVNWVVKNVLLIGFHIDLLAAPL